MYSALYEGVCVMQVEIQRNLKVCTSTNHHMSVCWTVLWKKKSALFSGNWVKQNVFLLCFSFKVQNCQVGYVFSAVCLSASISHSYLQISVRLGKLVQETCDYNVTGFWCRSRAVLNIFTILLLHANE